MCWRSARCSATATTPAGQCPAWCTRAARMVEIASPLQGNLPGLLRRPRIAWITRHSERILLPALILLILLAWDLLLVSGVVNKFLLPRPWAVLQALWTGMAGGEFLPHLLVTAYEAL